MRTAGLWLGLTLTACGGPSTPSGACTVTVEGGDAVALEEAVSALGDGDTICVGPGLFQLDAPLSIDARSAVTIRGAGLAEETPTELLFSRASGSDAALSITGAARVNVEDLTILEPPGDGVRVTDSERVTVRRVEVRWDREEEDLFDRGDDGFHVEGSRHVSIERARSSGAAGAGMHLVDCELCLLLENESFDGRAGFWLDGATGSELRGNTAEGNATGVLVLASSGTTVRANLLADANGLAPADPESFLGYVPVGTGVLVIASSDTEIRDNRIEDAPAAGIVVLSLSTLTDLLTIPSAARPAPAERENDVVNVYGDTFVNVAFDPSSAPGDPLEALFARASATDSADLVWDGALASGDTPDTLCFQPDDVASFLDLDARGGFMNVSDDASAHDCMHPAHEPLAPAQD